MGGELKCQKIHLIKEHGCQKGSEMGPIELKESTFVMWRIHGHFVFSNMIDCGNTWGVGFSARSSSI
jgi:hypothetical protein